MNILFQLRKRNLTRLSLFLLFTFIVSAFSCNAQDNDRLEFNKLNASKKWNMLLDDPCTQNWQDNWFLDGLIAKVENSEKGMNFIAGPINRNDAHHAVLWSKQIFKGDIKLVYEYTKTDSQVVNVNILYIHANGIGTSLYDKDISKWNKLREVPKMSLYYNYMNALHVSYAAFPMVNEDSENDYIRIRKYPVTEIVSFADMEVKPAFFKTGLFLPNVSYKMTVIKTDTRFFIHVKGDQVDELYSWNLTNTESIKEGRIGLRHMYTRSANYKNFKVSVK